MEMHQMRYFLAVSERLNFTRAAESCHVSQPSLTLAIKKLEGEMGGRLFHRERGRISLTELGSTLQPHFEQILGESQAAQQAAQHLLNLEKSPLKVGVLETIGPMPTSKFLSRFKVEHPGIEVELFQQGHAPLLKRLLKGDLDVAMTNHDGPFEEAFQTEELYEESYVVIFAPGHRFQRHKSIRLRDVSGEPYVDRLACEMRDAVIRTCGEMEVDLYATHRSESENWVQAMVLAGMGFAFMPEFSITLGGLKSRPLVEPIVARRIALVTVKEREPSMAGTVFIAGAKRHSWGGPSRNVPAAAP